MVTDSHSMLRRSPQDLSKSFSYDCLRSCPLEFNNINTDTRYISPAINELHW